MTDKHTPGRARTGRRRRGTAIDRLRPALTGIAVSVILTLGALAGAASAGAYTPPTITKTFSYSGSSASFTVPAAVTFLDLTADGGGGASGDGDVNIGSTPGTGGAAGEITGTLPVNPGDQVYFFVGGAGATACPADGTGGAGGATGLTGGSGGVTSCPQDGNGGGGATSIYLNGPVGQATPVAVAGGGGGGGGAGVALSGSTGGTGGIGLGNFGGDGDGTEAGQGGAGDAGGAIDGGTQASPGLIGLISGGGGGGGGGYPKAGNGGTAGGSDGDGGGGGGGGDSFTGGPANVSGEGSGPLVFDTITPSQRGADSNGRLTITYKVPIVQVFASASPAASVLNQPVTYTATVQSVSGAGIPTGTVRFSTGASPLCTARLGPPDTTQYAAADASCTSSRAPMGTDTVQVSYSGDATFSADSSTTTTETVTPPPADTRTTPSASPLVSGPGRPVTYSAKVRALSGSAVPSGTIIFRADQRTLCSTSALTSAGTASCTTSGLAPGPHTVTAAYSGVPGKFNPSSGTTIEIVIRGLG